MKKGGGNDLRLIGQKRFLTPLLCPTFALPFALPSAYGLPREWIEKLEKAAVPGTLKVVK